MNITTDNLFVIIGKQMVQISLLEAEVKRLNDLLPVEHELVDREAVVKEFA